MYPITAKPKEHGVIDAKRRRNRKRSKRREILCPEHQCYLDSVSAKQSLYADKAEQLQSRGLNRQKSMMLIAQSTTVTLKNEWLEACWCDHCYETKWYHIHQKDHGSYSVSVATRELWQQAQNVDSASGNPSVSEFTRRSAANRPAFKTALVSS